MTKSAIEFNGVFMRVLQAMTIFFNVYVYENRKEILCVLPAEKT